jgi:hypothetical protein
MLTYTAAHQLMGRADEHSCPCGRQAQQWSFQGSGDTLCSPQGYEYSESSDDYIPLCISCHKKQDIAAHPERFGHLIGCLVGGPEAMREKFLADPEFAKKRTEALDSIRADANAALRERWLTDPEFAAKMRGVANRRRRCLTCGMETTSGALGRHFKSSGHAGWEEAS